MKYFEKNMQALQERDEELYQAVREYAPEESDCSLELVQAKDGTDITKLIKDGKEWFLNSQYRPLQEAEKFAEQYEQVIDYSVMMFLGFGNGMIARQIQQSRGEHVNLLFYEASPAIFLHTLQHFDIAQLIENPNVFLYVKGMNDIKLETRMKWLVRYDNYKLCIYDALPKYKQIFPEEYAIMEEQYRYSVNNVRVNINTRRFFATDMTRNCIYNMRHMFHCNCEEEFEDLFPTDMPVIVVAAGPSLEKNVQLLKKAKGKAFILAVDTALRYLAEQDIQPDLAVSVDPRKPLELFENEKVQQMPLALDISLNYEIVDKMAKQKLVFVCSDNIYYDKMFQLTGKHIGFLSNGGSVATVAFAMAMNWGFRRIVLVGQDLALTADKVHAGKDDIDTEKLTNKQIPIEGYYGETVYTSPDYNEYRKWYEMMLRTHDTIEVINATEGGARIEGAIQMPLAEVIDTYCKDSFDFEGVIRDLPPAFVAESKQQLFEMWNTSVRNFVKLERRLKEGIHNIEQGMRMIKQGDFTSKKMKNVHKKIDKILEECGSMDEICFVDSMIAEKEEDVLGDLFEMADNEQEEYQRLLEKLHRYITAMLSAVDGVTEMFEKVIEDTRPELQS